MLGFLIFLPVYVLTKIRTVHPDECTKRGIMCYSYTACRAAICTEIFEHRSDEPGWAATDAMLDICRPHDRASILVEILKFIVIPFLKFKDKIIVIDGEFEVVWRVCVLQ
jgi:hypothetical protein